MVEITITKRVNTDKRIDAPCGTCKANRKHMILSDIELKGREATPDFLIYGWDDTYQIIQCLGCETVSFKKTHQNSEDEFHFEGPDGYERGWRVREDYFPNPEEGRAPIDGIRILPVKLQQIYKETLGALNSDFSILVGIGIRAIIETVCNDRQAAGKNLAARINDLVAKGFLTEEGSTILHQLRTMGNDAAHEAEPHDHVQLGIASDVVEHLLKDVYIIPHHAARNLP